MKRNIRPKPDVAVSCAAVTQLTSLAVLGIDERRFLEWLVPKAQGVVEIGRIRLVLLDEAMRVLRVHARVPPKPKDGPLPPWFEDTGEEEPQSVDEVLARLGRRRITKVGTTRVP